LRSGTSVGANLVEGIAGSSKNEVIKFNIIALKSANETKYWLCLIRDTVSNVNSSEIEDLINEVNEISKIIAAIVVKSRMNKS
ncbi:MAG: four helix bundle protein, partial [Sphingobacteriales bacterium]|nr:four helix bundle protein [Sphingobacteriales bacterium]